MACNIIQSVQCSLDKNTCEIAWQDGHISRFHAKWLRFNCFCEMCKAPTVGVYRIDIAAFPDELLLKDAVTKDNGFALQTTYDGDLIFSHSAYHRSEWLRSKCYCKKCLDRKIRRADVITHYVTDGKRDRIPRRVEFEELKTDKGLFKMVKNVVETGLCLVKNVPTQKKMVLKIAEMVGHIESSTYGVILDVFAKDSDSDNVACTALKLPLHQDQINYETAPGIQMLHAVAFDECVTGGDSTLVDIFEAVGILREESPESFRTLLEVPSTHETIDPKAERFFQHQKYNVTLDYFGKIVGVAWNPATLGTPQICEHDVDRYYKAHSALLKVVRQKDIQFRFKLERGDLLVFNNRRMVHARDAFQINGGNRHLQGIYMKLDDWKSKYVTLAKRLDKDVTPPKIGNNSSF